MSFRLALAQSGYPADGDVLAQVEAFAVKARDAGARLLAFPENLMSPRPLKADELRELAQGIDGPFVTEVGRIAATHGLWIVGTMSETNPGEPCDQQPRAPFNTAFVVDEQGSLRGTYRKCHLYDAHGVRESDRMTAGGALLEPIATPFCTLGIGICYDLRFPELARSAALAGCDLLLYPAAWHDGPRKLEHWQTLLRARAIENELFVAGIGHAASRHVGASLVADPWGEVLAQGPLSVGNQEEALVVADIDPARVRKARAAMPVLAHRRPELYHDLTETGSRS